MHLISSTKLLPTLLIQMKAGNTTHQRAASWQSQSDYIITLLLLAPFKTLLCFFPFIQAFTKLLKECVIMYKVVVLQSFHKTLVFVTFPETLNDADPSHSLVGRCEPTSIKNDFQLFPYSQHIVLCVWFGISKDFCHKVHRVSSFCRNPSSNQTPGQHVHSIHWLLPMWYKLYRACWLNHCVTEPWK